MTAVAGQARRNITAGCSGRRVAARNGFTLVELVLVLALLAVIMGMAAPSLRGFAKGSRMRNTAESLAATARWARAQAIVQGKVYRLEIGSGQVPFTVSRQDGQEFVSVSPPGIGVKELPDGVTITLLGADGSNFQSRHAISVSSQSTAGSAGGSQPAVYFLPTGRTDPAMFRLEGTNGSKMDVVCLTPSENFQVVSATEAAK